MSIATPDRPPPYAAPAHPEPVYELREGLEVDYQTFALLDHKGFELVEGVVREKVVSEFSSAFQYWLLLVVGQALLKQPELGFPTEAGGGDRCFAHPDTLRKPDFAWTSRERRRGPAKRRGYSNTAPNFVVEVLCPSNERAAIAEKVAMYRAASVDLVWVVDPVALTAVVHDAAGVRTFAADQPLPCPMIPGLSVTLQQVADLVARSEGASSETPSD